MYIRPIWVSKFEGNDISLGIHICWVGRLDIHILFWMISIGVVPIYKIGIKSVAVSNSYHDGKDTTIRAGIPK